MELDKAIGKASDSIKGTEQKKQRIARELKAAEKKIKFGGNGFLEDFFVKKEQPAELNCKIAGVDSGFASKELFAIDLILTRAVGTCFEYKKSTVKECKYWPNTYSFPEPFISTEYFERDEFNSLVSIKRLLKEIEATKKCIEEFKPKYCFIDGSIVPQHHDKPRSKNTRKHYREMIESFQEMYGTSEQNNCTLIASVEDSRGNRWRQIMQEKLGEKGEEMKDMQDTVLLDAVLGKFERTPCFSYAKSSKEHPILQDFGEKWSEKISAFYIRPSLYDFPLRIEFLQGNGGITEKATEIAQIVLAQSSMHKEYAYPTVLIEADLRAKLKPEEINIVCDKIIDKIGKNAFTLRRRDRRPF